MYLTKALLLTFLDILIGKQDRNILIKDNFAL